MTLSDHERQAASGPTFPADLRTLARKVCPTAIEFSTLTHVGERRVGVSYVSSMGQSPQRTQIWGPRTNALVIYPR